MIEPGEVLVQQKFIRSGDLVYDVGASDGCWTESARSFHPDARYEMFDPRADAHPAAHRIALTDHNGSAVFHLNTGDKNQSSLFRCFDAEIGVCARRLGQLDEIPDFLKLDVEGAEVACLRGAGTRLCEIRVIQFEYGGTYTAAKTTLKDAWDLLFPSFAIFKIHADRLEPIPQWLDALENYEYSNWLAVRRAP